MNRLLPEEEGNHVVLADLYAVAYRTTGVGTRMRLEAWPLSLTVGAILPTLPLWIGPTAYVPLDLESSYQSACASLRIQP
jgi:hypothetical protein